MPANLRRDARANRQRLVDHAAAAFAEVGLDAAPAEIARRAGLGIGTLYRHFPTREALIAAAYQHELDRLCDRVPGLLAVGTAAEALRAWIGHFLDYITAKHGMSDALNVIIASGADPYNDNRESLEQAVGALLAAGAADGSLRSDVTDDDVLLAISGIAQATSAYGTRQQADRLTALLLDALTRGVTAAR